MTGFEPWSSGIGSDRAVNCATTIDYDMLYCLIDNGRSFDEFFNGPSPMLA